MPESVLLFDGRDEYGFACFVPSFAFAFNGNGCLAAGTYDGLAESIVSHVARGEVEQVLVVEFALFLLFAYLPPIDVTAFEGRFLFVLQ